jgi:8-oxo-dGTP pyrophosphatase MutT (NUDIX family)
MPPETAIKPWPIVTTKTLANYRIFQLRTDLKVNPRTGSQHDFFVIDCADWVNVVALTPSHHVVMIEQFRHGTNTVELEIPGGIMDPHETDPTGAGPRELREETGYEGAPAKLIGTIFPNPAIQSNRCHTVLVEAAELRHATEFDHGEDIAVRLVPLADIPGLIASGAIRHALVVVALTHFLLHWQARHETASR